MKKNILIFGDSNTYGYNPGTNGRYDKSRRWSGILSDLLGEDYHINEEGCNNRTAFFINPDGKLQSGLLYIDDCLKKYQICRRKSIRPPLQYAAYIRQNLCKKTELKAFRCCYNILSVQLSLQKISNI